MVVDRKPKKKPLRQRAEKLLSKESPRASKIEDKDLKKLVHELEESRSKYSDLYDFAPIGYFTFSPAGEILEVNLTGASLLGIERDKLIRKPFAVFVEAEFQSHFRNHCHDMLSSDRTERCELKLIKKDGTSFYASLRSIAVHYSGSARIRSAVSDITELKRVQTEIRQLNAELEDRIRRRTAELETANQRLRQEVSERKLTEEALREDQALLTAIMESTPDPVYVKDTQSRIVTANPALAEVVGKPLEEILGRTDSEYYGDLATGQALREHDLRVMESGQSEVTEETVPTPRGYRTFLSSKAPYRNESGDIIGITGISRDITERKWAEEALRKSEERYRTLFEGAPDAIVVHRDGRFLDANEEALRLMGAGSFEELTRHGVLDFSRPEDFERSAERMRLAREEGRLPIREATLLRLDGREVAVEFHTAKTDFHGGPAVQTIIRDITEQKRAQEALRDSEERFRTLADATFEGIAITEQGRIVDANEQLAQIIGGTQSELIGQEVTSLIVPEDRDRVMANILQGVESHIEHRMFRQDGTRITVEAHGRTIPYQDRQVRITAIRDITERKRAEEAAREAHEHATWLARFPEQSPSPVVRASAAGTVLYCNPTSSTLPDWKCEVGQVLRNDLLPLLGRAIAKKRKVQADIELDGRFYMVLVVPFPQDGYVNIYGRDITERKRAEENLKQRTLDLQHLTETLEERVKERTLELASANKAVRESESRLQFLSTRLLETQEEERKRFAAEVHDSFSSSLSAIKYRINVMQTANSPTAEDLERLNTQVQGLIEESRRIQMALRPSILDDLGTLPALNWLAREFQKTYSHMGVTTGIDVEEPEIPHNLKTPIFRISQEAFHNAAKHSKAKSIKLSLGKKRGALQLDIHDNGVGIGSKILESREDRGRGLGLVSMEERASLSGGVFTIHSEVGKGTTIRVSWPLK